jgi:hypothetical protein
MKVGPLPPQPDPPRPALPPGASSRAFAEFLADPSARASGFAELGMFGLNQAQVSPPPGAAREAPALAPPPRNLPDPALPAGRTRWLAPGESPAKSISRALPEPAICALPRAAPVKAAPGDICSLPGVAGGSPLEAEDRAAPQVSARAARLRLRQAALKAGISLVLNEQNGAVEIVARGPTLDPSLCARLRRLAEAMLAPSGLRLAQFKLNGVPLAPDFLGRTGGKNGTRSD